MPLLHFTHLLPPLAAACLLLVATTSPARAQTAPLNDTGQTKCYGVQNSFPTPVPCDSPGFPGQDLRYGRDAAQAAGQLTKVGGGAAGFDFTALDTSGTPQASPGNGHACVRDNVTGLIWSTQSVLNTWADAPPAAGYSRCGYTNTGASAQDWRVPTRRELLSIVHRGVHNPSPTVDTDYFPGTETSRPYWAAETYPTDTTHARVVFFSDGTAVIDNKGASRFVRLVRKP
ncbi:DUF1566 domain-containing protein [Ottowia sp. VDI28]|uniref:Lcl C-terminal domain-containing protein n=1 Tax=Ottowia sp. VDI28 TaxID=3133968 RepID=UPI003C2D8FEB